MNPVLSILRKKLKQGIEKISRKVSSARVIREEDLEDALWDFEVSLLEGDVAHEVAEKIISDVKASLVGRKGPVRKLLLETVRKSLLEIVSVEPLEIKPRKKPWVVLFLGFNGSGKTTSVAKFGKILRDSGFSVVFAAADTFRAAAIEQLKVHGQSLGIRVISQGYGSDPAAVVYDAVNHAKSRGIDAVLVDTAGRSHSNRNLMEELKKITRVGKPDLKVLVIDSLTGNDVVEQVRLFDGAVGVDAFVFTKFDVCEKGGSVLSALFTLKRPVLFLSSGQGYDEVLEFDPKAFVDNLINTEK